ncbi:hypothetical protein FOA52_013361 [Chlamydomonas sp. UWO 241]|nr:hypothetical protein FOA52_013361 [Chlamydomonas sp. UWO 241]
MGEAMVLDGGSSGAPEDPEMDEMAMLGVLVMLAAGLFIGKVVQRSRVQWISEAAAGLLLGLAVGMLLHLAGVSEAFGMKMGFRADFFMMILMPAIAFDAGYNLDAKSFLRNVGPICMTAFAGTTISTAVMAIMMWTFGAIGWCYPMPFLFCLTFGAIISATDPVAVLAVFQSLGANPDLYINVFGEAVLNDAVAMVLYTTISAMIDAGIGPGRIIGGVFMFVTIFVGSVVVGIATGLVAAWTFRSGFFHAGPTRDVPRGLTRGPTGRLFQQTDSSGLPVQSPGGGGGGGGGGVIVTGGGAAIVTGGGGAVGGSIQAVEHLLRRPSMQRAGSVAFPPKDAGLDLGFTSSDAPAELGFAGDSSAGLGSVNGAPTTADGFAGAGAGGGFARTSLARTSVTPLDVEGGVPTPTYHDQPGGGGGGGGGGGAANGVGGYGGLSAGSLPDAADGATTASAFRDGTADCVESVGLMREASGYQYDEDTPTAYQYYSHANEDGGHGGGGHGDGGHGEEQREFHAEVAACYETALVLVFGYFSYILATAAYLSGITAIVTTGMVMNAYMRPSLSEPADKRVAIVSKTLATTFELFAFIYIGLSVLQEQTYTIVSFTKQTYAIVSFTEQTYAIMSFTEQTYAMMSFTEKTYAVISFTDQTYAIISFTALCLFSLGVSRFLNIVPMIAVVNLVRLRENRISGRQQLMMWWSGLRGPMAFALALDASEKYGDHGRVMKTCTLYVVLITVIINGGGTPYLMRYLRLRKSDMDPTQSQAHPDRERDDPRSDDSRSLLGRPGAADVSSSAKSHVWPSWGDLAAGDSADGDGNGDADAEGGAQWRGGRGGAVDGWAGEPPSAAAFVASTAGGESAGGAHHALQMGPLRGGGGGGSGAAAAGGWFSGGDSGGGGQGWSGLFATLRGVNRGPQQEGLLASTQGLRSAVGDAAGAPVVTPAEVRAAATHSKPGTAPGPDGIPVDVWRKLGEPVFVLLAAVFTAVGATGETPPGFLDGVVASIYKAKDAADAANYHPLTMLSSGYRILAKMLPGLLAANAAEGVGPTGAALALLDFRKAYDTIDRGCLLAVMEAVDAGDGMLAWTRTILTHTYASAEVNRFISEPRQYAAGVRQGCPAAPALFLFLGHALACFLRTCPTVCAGLRTLEAAVPGLWRLPLLSACKEPIWRLWVWLLQPPAGVRAGVWAVVAALVVDAMERGCRHLWRITRPRDGVLPPDCTVSVERAGALATMDLWDALASFAEGGVMPRGWAGVVGPTHPYVGVVDGKLTLNKAS